MMRAAVAIPLLCLLAALSACSAAESVMFKPRPEDPMDGYAGSLAQAGVNTEMDWGPRQQLLLDQFKLLQEEHSKLQRSLSKTQDENQSLRAQLAGETETASKEKSLRLQAEAESELLRQKRRELEARILSLGIEKAKLEQTALLAKIAELQRTLEDLAPATPADASAPAAAPVRR